MPTTTPPKSKPTPMRAGTLTASKKTTPTSKPDRKIKATGPGKVSAKEDGGALGEHHRNGVEGVLLAAGEDLHHESVQSDAETHEPESDCEHGHLGNGSLETSYTEELPETTEDASLHYQADQEHVEEPEEITRSNSSESVQDDAVPEHPHGIAGGEELEQEQAKDEIADIVGLLESTSFSSKHILQGSDEGVVVSDSRTPGSDNERRIGEIPDESE